MHKTPSKFGRSPILRVAAAHAEHRERLPYRQTVPNDLRAANAVIWAIEEQVNGRWLPRAGCIHTARDSARRNLAWMKNAHPGLVFRVRAYVRRG